MSGRGERLRPAAAVALVALVALAAPAAAVAARPRQMASGLAGSSQWAPDYAISGTLEGEFGPGTYIGTLTTAGASYTSAACGPVCAALAGTITFSTRAGTFTAAAQPGSVVSMEEIATHSFRDFRLELRIVGGTGRYAHARGRLSLSYSSVWTHEWTNGVLVESIADAGTLIGTIR